MRRHAVILAVALAWLIGIGRAEAKLDILVDKATQRMLVMQDGYMRYIWPVSTGRDELATPNGVYAPQRLERNWFSRAYYNSPMPYSIFFHNGYAIHGSYAINQLGGPASHGCVRLHPHHAALLFDLVQQEGPANTTIEITDGQQPEESPVPPREIAMGRSVDPPVAPREIATERSVFPPTPRIVRYRNSIDLAEPSPAPREYRPIVARNVPPPRPPASRRMLADVRQPAGAAHAPCGGGEGAASSRLSNESPDCRGKPKAAEAPQPEQTQQAPLPSGFKLLPASCWSGGASRWRWWNSVHGVPCK